MRVFRVVLSIGTTFIEADHYLEGKENVGFYRGESLIAQFAKPSVKEITESPDLGPRKGLFERLREEPPPSEAPPP
jgi:hypothetical protein